MAEDGRVPGDVCRGGPEAGGRWKIGGRDAPESWSDGLGCKPQDESTPTTPSVPLQRGRRSTAGEAQARRADTSRPP